ncbi:hypothetical protein [Tractidigestivibacter sp.]|uniref:hypothetical protein n=1 Tax=Tractidigestivibacter sp. TaxID=2847320 RepID=UPI002A90C8F6|nr:hypothetical protein [Tractidigestivibacter sp.]MDY5271871.1 hypothetical protein [Tractidigestivibacter sp.]
MGAPLCLPYVSDDVLGLLELMGYRGLERAEASDVVAAREAALLGRGEAACWVGCSLDSELVEMGVEVRWLGAAPGGDGASVRVAALATYDPRPSGARRVDLYLGEISRKHKVLLGMGVEMGLDDLVGLHLAHEFYHVLEFSRGQRAAGLVPKVRVHGLLGARLRPPRRAGEVAAHAFARALAGHGPHPALVDALVLVGSGVVSAEALLERAARARDLLDTCLACG